MECFRIFIKIINFLVFYYGKKGIRKGYLFNIIIIKDEFNYNCINW